MAGMTKYVFAAAAAAQVLSCAHGPTVGEMQRLRDQLARVSSDHDQLERRVTVMELAMADRPDAPVARVSLEAPVPNHAEQAKIVGLDPDAMRVLNAAMNLFREQKYDRASEAFAGFVVKWPDSSGVENAMYWRAECAFAKGDYARAVEQFEGMMARFEEAVRAPEALLRLGQSHRKLGSKEKAKSYFERLLREFPQSEAARSISKQETN